MQKRVMENVNIEILFEHNTLGLFGKDSVEGAHLIKRAGESDEEKVDINIDGFSSLSVTNQTRMFSGMVGYGWNRIYNNYRWNT